MIENVNDEANKYIISESSSSSSLISYLTSSISLTTQGNPSAPPPTPISFTTTNSENFLSSQQSLIPIYQLQQSVPDTINESENRIINNFYLDPANSGTMKPSSRSVNRRECKSTSDEPFVYELNNNNNNNNNYISTQQVEHINTTSLFNNEYLIKNGKFGFNLSKFKKLTNNFKNTNNHKTVKRLNNSNKSNFFIENLNKTKHTNFNHNKKLFQAIMNNDLTLVCELLDSCMYDVNCFDDKQRTCLHIACSRGYADIVRVLLDYGANPNLRDCVSNLPIHLAIISSHVQVVTILLEAGTDIHSLDLHGKTVLHLAGTRLRWLLNDENNKASPKLKFEAIMIMNMIKEYLRRKKSPNTDLDKLVNQLENTFNLQDINSLTKEFLNKFEAFNLDQQEIMNNSKKANKNYNNNDNDNNVFVLK